MEIIVIGGIAAGMSVAAKAARTNKDARITVLEKEDYVSFGACGLPYYLGGQFDDENEMYSRTADQMREAGINIELSHEVLSVDFDHKKVEVKDLKNDTTKTLDYDKLMIATGATAIVPPIEGVDSENVYTITKPYTVNKLKANLDQYQDIVVIGGGFIGVEVAEQLAHLGKTVHVVEALDHIMSGPFDIEFTDKLKEALEETGTHVHTSERAERFIVEAGKVVSVKTNKQTLKADAVIMSVGFRPNTHFVKDQLEMLGNGAIVINKYGQTSRKDVFAAGDCASIPHRLSGNKYIPLATYANKMGRLIGSNIVLEEKDWLGFAGALGSSAIKVGNYEASSTGLTEKEAKDLGKDVKTTLIYANNHSNYYTDVPQDKVMIKLIYDANTKVLYGAQLFGKNETVLRMTGLTTAIHAGLTTDEIGFIDYAYAPPFASTWEALNVAANTAI